MKSFLRIFLALCLGGTFMLTSLSACTNDRLYDIDKNNTVLTVAAADFVSSTHRVHERAYMDSAYTALCLDADVENSEGYLAQTIGYYLDEGTYRFTARARVSLGNGSDPVVELHVLDRSGRVAAALQINGPTRKSVFVDYALNVTLPKDYYRFALYTNGRNAVEMEQLVIESISPDTARAITAGSILKEDAQDLAIEFDDSKLYYLDLLSMVQQYDDFRIHQEIMTTVVALQGLVNRDKPRLFIRFLDDVSHNQAGEQDLFWLDYLSETKNFLPKEEGRVTVKSVGTLLRIFRSFYNGLAVWDNAVPATYNVAFTDCGVNSNIPVRYSSELDSFYRYMTQVLKLPVKLDLYNKFDGKSGSRIWGTDLQSTGSKKNDVYRWAIEQYLRTADESQQTNPHVLSKYLDGWVGNNGVTPNVYYGETGQLVVGAGGVPHWNERYKHTDIVNLDYFVAKKAFFFDLSPTGEPPIDDPNQSEGLDGETFELILLENNKRAGDTVVQVGGFTSWQLKYSDTSTPGAIGGGSLEAVLSVLLTRYNAAMQADAHSISGMSNASVYTLLPAKQQYSQKTVVDAMKAKADSAVLENKNYILTYQGDYDGAAWINRVIPAMFNDPKRGDAPLMWPIVAINEERVKHVYEYMYENATANDVFVGGNNGYGYSYLDVYLTTDRTGINGDLDSYFRRTAEMYQKYDLDVNGMYFGGWDASSAQTHVWQSIYAKYAEIAPYGVSMSRGRRISSQQDYFFNNAIFMGRDPIDNTNNVIQCGNQGVLIEGEAEHQVDIFSNTINVTAEKRPHFTLIRPILATPTQVVDAIAELNTRYPHYNYEIVDPYTFFKLYKEFCDRTLAGEY